VRQHSTRGNHFESPRKALSTAAHAVSGWAGSLTAIILVSLAVVVSLVVGTIVHFPPWWQTVVYSTNSIVTLLMLFIIQHTTDQQTGAILLKLDELVHSSSEARDDVIGAEDQDIDTQEQLHHRLHR
jgi:low affinity Fe/Cu permease